MRASSKACCYPSDISDTPRKMSVSPLGAMCASVRLLVVCVRLCIVVVGATPAEWGWWGCGGVL